VAETGQRQQRGLSNVVKRRPAYATVTSTQGALCADLSIYIAERKGTVPESESVHTQLRLRHLCARPNVHGASARQQGEPPCIGDGNDKHRSSAVLCPLDSIANNHAVWKP
jgi:hypothetical protein